MRAESQKPFQKIVLCEWGMHQEVLYTYLMHFLPLTNKISVCCYRWVACQMQEIIWPIHIEWITEDASTAYVEACQKTLVDCDFAIITTLPSKKSRLDNLQFRKPVFLLIHNTCFQLWQDFRRQEHLDQWFQIRQFLKWITFRLSGEAYRQKQWVQKSNNIIFSSYNMKKYYLENTSSNSWPNPMVIPSGHHISIQINKYQSEKLKIGIPGNINFLKKDYKVLSDGLKYFAESHRGDAELIFMGKCDASVRKLIRNMETGFSGSGINIVTYPDYLPHKEYVTILHSLDLMIWNFKKIKPYGPFNEIFGYTTESGAVGDMIKYGIPSVIPDFYPIARELEKLVVRFSDSHSLATAITKIETRKKIFSNPADLSSWQYPNIGKCILQQMKQHVEKA